MRVIRALCIAIVVSVHGSALAQSTVVEVDIESVDPVARTITVIRNGKVLHLDVVRRAVVVIAGKESTLSSLLPGDKATVEYQENLEVVTKITAQGGGKIGWRFYDVFGRGINAKRAFVIARDGRLICRGDVGGFCFATLHELSDVVFTIEFQFPAKEFKGSPYIAVAGILPNPNAADWTEQIPKGIQVKLQPDKLGEFMHSQC